MGNGRGAGVGCLVLNFLSVRGPVGNLRISAYVAEGF